MILDVHRNSMKKSLNHFWIIKTYEGFKKCILFYSTPTHICICTSMYMSHKWKKNVANVLTLTINTDFVSLMCKASKFIHWLITSFFLSLYNSRKRYLHCHIAIIYIYIYPHAIHSHVCVCMCGYVGM